MNHGYSYNTLNKSLTKEIEDYLVFYDVHPTIRCVILQAMDQRVFSFGTDFKTLAFAAKEKNFEEAKSILNNLCYFSHFMASYSKPYALVLNGLLLNSAASIFLQQPFVFAKQDVSAAFNEADLCAVPNGGSSFFLTRMPSDIGICLALTGMIADTDDLAFLQCVSGLYNPNEKDLRALEKAFARDYTFLMLYSSPTGPYKHTLSRKVDLNKRVEEFLERRVEENPKKVLFDLFYRKKLIEDNELKMRKWTENIEERQHFDKSNNPARNSVMDMFLNRLYSVINPEELSATRGNLYSHRGVIAECFSGDTVEEIIAALKRNGTNFALRCALMMEARDKKVLQVILNLLRKAVNMDFMECMEEEYRLLMALATSDKISNVFTKDFVLHKDFSVEEIEQQAHAKKADGEFRFSMEFKHEKNSILPASQYWQTYNEGFRSYFNQTQVRDQRLYAGMEDFIRLRLTDLGIDHISPTFDRKEIAKKLRQLHDWQFLFQKKEERLDELVFDSSVRKNYFDSRRKEIGNLATPEGEKQIIEAIKSALGSAIRERAEEMTHKNRELFRLERIATLDELKNFIMDNRLMVETSLGTTEESERKLEEQQAAMPIEIAGHRNKFSEDFKRKIEFEKLKANYKRSFSGSKLDLAKNNSFVEEKITAENLYRITTDFNNLWAQRRTMQSIDNLKQRLKIWYMYHRTAKFKRHEESVQAKFIKKLIADYELKHGKLPLRVKDALTKGASEDFFIKYDWNNPEQFLLLIDNKQFSTSRMSEPDVQVVTPKAPRPQAILEGRQKAPEEIDALLLKSGSSSNVDKFESLENIKNGDDLIKMLDHHSLLFSEIADYLRGNKEKIVVRMKKAIFEAFEKTFAASKPTLDFQPSGFEHLDHLQKKHLIQEVLLTCVKTVHREFGKQGLIHYTSLLRKLRSQKIRPKDYASQKKVVDLLRRHKIICIGKFEMRMAEEALARMLRLFYVCEEYGNDGKKNDLKGVGKSIAQMHKIAKYKIKQLVKDTTSNELFDKSFKSRVKSVKVPIHGIFMPAVKLEKTMLGLYRGTLGGINDTLRNLNKDNTNIPRYFEELDARQPADKWLSFHLTLYIKSILELRSLMEPHLNQYELLESDRLVSAFFDAKNLARILNRKLDVESYMLDQVKENSNFSHKEFVEAAIGGLFTPTKELNIRKRIKDEGELKKLIALETFIGLRGEGSLMKNMRNHRMLIDLAKRALWDSPETKDYSKNVHDEENLKKANRRESPFAKYLQKDDVPESEKLTHELKKTDLYEEMAKSFQSPTLREIRNSFRRSFAKNLGEEK